MKNYSNIIKYHMYKYFKNNVKYKFFIFILFILLWIFFSFYQRNNFIYIPEILNYDNQRLKIIVPKKKCHSCKLTLFFSSKFRETHSLKEFDIIQINLTDKDYFVTFFVDNINYFFYIQFLKDHGLIRSNNIKGKNNIFLTNNINEIIQTSSNQLNNYQKIYQYISADFLFQKNSLFEQYKYFKKLYNDDFDYMPETFIYPEDKYLILNKFNKYKLDMDNLWLIKPTNKCSGEGIKILKTLKSIKNNEFILTKYIKNIDLIKGKKYDLRLYVLISGLKPLRIYFYNEGLVRIASEKYSINPNNIGNNYIHLTNTDINKHNKNFINPNNSNNENSNIWNILMYKKYLKEKHSIEWKEIRIKLKDIIIKTIISLQHKLIEDNEKRKLNDKNFYNLLGFDILITNDLIPKLLEVNHSPAMYINNNLERLIKNNLFTDTLNLIGISPFSRKKNKPLIFGVYNKNERESNINDALCEIKRPRGDYELIFPLKSNINIYKKYFINNSNENIIFWSKI